MDTNYYTEANRETAYARGAKINHTSKSHDVMEVVTALVYSAVPGATIRESCGFYNEKHQVVCFNMPNYSSNWVVIISNDNVHKNGTYSLEVFHLSGGINFSEYYDSPYKNNPFPDAYAIMCKKSNKLLHYYPTLLTPEGLVVEMLCNKTTE